MPSSPEHPSPSSPKPDMRLPPARTSELQRNLSAVLTRIDAARGPRPVRLVAVSKLKTAREILALHLPPSPTTSSETPTSPPSSAPSSPSPLHSDFGENYAQELIAKADILPDTIRWHMIGALQTNKCKPLAETVRNLYSVSSVDSVKKADALEKGRAALHARFAEQQQNQNQRPDLQRLRIMIQINTSGEENKSGLPPDEALAMVRHVREKCPHLRVGGFMTIGAIARSASAGDAGNEDFDRLRETRDRVEDALREEGGGKEGDGDGEEGGGESLQLSMGMSADFEAAIRQGSDEVRVGTTIFGTRPAKGDATIL